MTEIVVEVKEDDDSGIGGGTFISLAGMSISGITLETPQVAVDKFVKLCYEHEAQLKPLLTETERCRELNMKALNEGGQGKNWPAFNARERFIQRLLDQAGVVDS